MLSGEKTLKKVMEFVMSMEGGGRDVSEGGSCEADGGLKMEMCVKKNVMGVSV